MARQHNAEETKEMIINSAIKCFLDKGYSKTTLEDIVKGVGLTRGAFYWNFENKRQIMDEVLARYEQFYLDIYHGYQREETARETLKEFLLLDLRSKNSINPYAIIVRYKIEATEEMVGVRELQGRLDKQLLHKISEEIAWGQRRGEFKTDRSSDRYALMIYYFLLGFDTYNVANYSEKGGHFLSDETIEEYVEDILNSLEE